ncbi:carboxylesterase family protein [Apiospora rasikravindrae]|uniref:Carboxylic ester hydrolase n=1 Tax=Apiospora rasikravindrae TaxID=990691 RepID=A0ABR1UD58_9PEZI
MLRLSLLAAVGCSIGPAFSAPVTGDANSAAPSVTVKNGTYSGIHSESYDQDFFLGMPYSQKAVRFTQAESLNSTWEGAKEATAYPLHCIGYGADEVGYELSEDCLYLNVVRPAGLSETADLPVAVWIHGGGLFMGGSGDKRYNMSFMVENSVKQGTPMIGVSLNYRLSAFGFLSGKEVMDAGLSNIGFHDQRLALRWINENIASFGGSPEKVTIFGESSGAESVHAQVFAFNGRDDGLFRGAMAQSGFGQSIFRFPGGLNDTVKRQETFDNLVKNVTSCASTVGTADAIPCLRTAPFEEINHALNVSSVGPWAPQFDGDFFADHPENQLNNGKFPKIPILIGENTDEGSAFGSGRGPNGGPINTDADFEWSIRNGLLGSQAAEASGKSVDVLTSELMALYPNIQSLGIPSLASWPEIINSTTEGVEKMGLQYRRGNALFGDVMMHYARRRANIAWAKAGLPSWSFRFDVTTPGSPGSVSATHFQEVAYVFNNLGGDGYTEDQKPFPADAPGIVANRDLAFTISSAWVNFVTGLDPNGDNVKPAWPRYDLAAGGGVGQNMVFAVEGQGSYAEIDDYRAEAINWMIENSLTVFGS